MILWKNLKTSTIVDACVGMSIRRAERLEAAGSDTGAPPTDRRPGPETGNIATGNIATGNIATGNIATGKTVTGKTAPEAIQPAE